MKTIMKRSVKIMGVSVVIVIVLLGATLFWASRTTLSSQKYHQTAVLEFSVKPSVNEKNTLKIMTYNIGFAGGVDGLGEKRLSQKQALKNLKEIATVIRAHNPDILAVQEIDRQSRRSGRVDQVEYLAKELGYPYVVFNYTWAKRWVPYPLTLKWWTHFGDVQAGQALFSKYPIKQTGALRFEKPKRQSWIYSLFYLDRLVQWAKIEISETQSISIANVHLEAWDQTARAEQAQKMLDRLLIENVEILVGDLNTVPDISLKKSGFIDSKKDNYEQDPTYARITHLYKDSLHTTDVEVDAKTWTYPSNQPTRRLDFIGAIKALRVAGVQVSNDTVASDHRPIIAEIGLSQKL